MLKAKSENIILVFTANQYPCFETSLKDENCMKVFLNNQAHDSLNSLFEVLEKGNATGVTLYQR